MKHFLSFKNLDNRTYIMHAQDTEMRLNVLFLTRYYKISVNLTLTSLVYFLLSLR